MVAAANGISWWVARARPASSSRAGSHREPERGLDIQAEHPVIEINFEVQQASAAQLVYPAPDRGLVRVDGGGERGMAGPAVTSQLGQQQLVLGPGGNGRAGSSPVSEGLREDVYPGHALAGGSGGVVPPGHALAGGSGGVVPPGQHRQLRTGQGPGDALPGPRGELVQDRVRGDLYHPAAAGQPAQEQGVALLRRARLHHAADLGAARGQANPAGVRPAGQGIGERIGAARGGRGCRITDGADSGSEWGLCQAAGRRISRMQALAALACLYAALAGLKRGLRFR